MNPIWGWEHRNCLFCVMFKNEHYVPTRQRILGCSEIIKTVRTGLQKLKNTR